MDRVLVVMDWDTTECNDFLSENRFWITWSELKAWSATAECDIAPTVLGLRGEEVTKAFSCCGFDTWPSNLLDIGSMLSEPLFAASGNGHLRPQAKSRAAAIFRGGGFFGLGSLFYSAFTFNQTVTATVDKMLLPYADATKISVHVRHQGQRPQDFDEGAIKCIVRLSRQLSQEGKPCAVLLATDREGTVQRFAEASQEARLAKNVSLRNRPHMTPALRLFGSKVQRKTGCKVLTTPKIKEEGMSWEHGDWAGATAMMDLYMLGLGDIFVGTRASTFSVRAAELFMGRPSARGPKAAYTFSKGSGGGCKAFTFGPRSQHVGAEACRKMQCPNLSQR
eukprot:CAMPEP_0168426732 /NCGR_PEP_ID=MMETSP0228-20121227/35985_1 /TAXON_ID=133427 /ORGANISM="Protoceratium reticulatum, Strain CCCM 535 (=CCMP 1889)" /LENGTH=335 /DNA_ID=CAMNT_0008440753 /DNA_START=109 /DNA_END=1112 /DNA_ORIENTATION=+